jgi:hypothetical protein
VVLGDSTAGATGLGLRRWGAETGRTQVSVVSGESCTTMAVRSLHLRTGLDLVPAASCGSLVSEALAEAVRIDADALVVMIGSWQLADTQLADAPAFVNVGDPAFDAAYTNAVRKMVGSLAGSGLPILWADVAAPQWDPDAFGRIRGREMPGSGPVTINDAGRAERLNELDQRAFGVASLAVRLPIARHIASLPAGGRPDGLHIDPAALPDIVAGAILDDAIGAMSRVEPAPVRAP